MLPMESTSGLEFASVCQGVVSFKESARNPRTLRKVISKEIGCYQLTVASHWNAAHFTSDQLEPGYDTIYDPPLLLPDPPINSTGKFFLKYKILFTFIYFTSLDA